MKDINRWQKQYLLYIYNLLEQIIYKFILMIVKSKNISEYTHSIQHIKKDKICENIHNKTDP